MNAPTFPKGDIGAMIRRFLGPGQTAVDVGAHHGDFTAVMAESVGDTGMVYAFEPTRLKDVQFSKRMRVVPSKARVVVEHVALGEGVSTVPLYRPWTENASRWHGDEGPVDVPMTSLDFYFPTEPIALVKIDTQGSESHILDGAQALLKRCPVWILELWPWGLKTAQRSAEYLIGQLRSAGFVPRWMDGAAIDDAGLQHYLAAIDGADHKHANIYVSR